MVRTRRQQVLLATSGSPAPRSRSYAWATDSEHGFNEAVLLFDAEGRLVAVDYRRSEAAGGPQTPGNPRSGL